MGSHSHVALYFRRKSHHTLSKFVRCLAIKQIRDGPRLYLAWGKRLQNSTEALPRTRMKPISTLTSFLVRYGELLEFFDFYSSLESNPHLAFVTHLTRLCEMTQSLDYLQVKRDTSCVFGSRSNFVFECMYRLCR